MIQGNDHAEHHCKQRGFSQNTMQLCRWNSKMMRQRRTNCIGIESCRCHHRNIRSFYKQTSPQTDRAIFTWNAIFTINPWNAIFTINPWKTANEISETLFLFKHFRPRLEAHVRKVKSLFTNLDADESGYISLKELEQNMHKRSASWLKRFGVVGHLFWMEIDSHDSETWVLRIRYYMFSLVYIYNNIFSDLQNKNMIF